MRPWRLLRISVVTVCALAVIAVGGYGAYLYIVPRNVEGVKIEPKTIMLEIKGPALLDATNRVTITARIQGFLKTINVDRNDHVVQGQTLAQIESDDLSSQLAVAQADARAAELTIVEARNNQDSVRALADKARADFDRRRSLVQDGTISQADWTATEAAFKQTQADLARAGIAIDRLLAQSASANANVQLLQIRMNDAVMRSPLTGIVVSKNRNVGDLLAPGAALMEIVEPRSVILTARFDEAVMGTIKPGQQATARFTALPEKEYKGSVLRLLRRVDEETREFEADIVLDELPDIWALGQRANVVIMADRPTPTIAIPQDMIVRRRGRAGVWRVEHGRAFWTPVSLGFPSGTSIEIVRGVQSGDFVVRPNGIYPFQPVSVVTSQTVSDAETGQ